MPDKLDPDELNGAVVRINLLAFFHANPYTRDTAAGLARRINRDPKAVKQALKHLEQRQVISSQLLGSLEVYGLTRPYGLTEEVGGDPNA